MKILQYVVSVISVVGSIFLGGVFALIGFFQLLGLINREAMMINLIFGFGVLFMGCIVIPLLARKIFGIKNKKKSNGFRPRISILNNLGYDREIAKENGESFKELSMELDEIFK